METRAFWRLCSSCKKELPFASSYYRCSVSTCNRARMPLTFCSVACFEAHVPVVRHREAWAEEDDAPTREAWEREQAAEAADAAAAAATVAPARAPAPARAAEPVRVPVPAPVRAPVPAPVRVPVPAPVQVRAAEPAYDPAKERRIVGVGEPAKVGPVVLQDSGVPNDILIVASKLKAYVRARSGMNTSDNVMEALSDIVRELCDAAVQRAAEDGRKTVMARDF